MGSFKNTMAYKSAIIFAKFLEILVDFLHNSFMKFMDNLFVTISLWCHMNPIDSFIFEIVQCGKKEFFEKVKHLSLEFQLLADRNVSGSECGDQELGFKPHIFLYGTLDFCLFHILVTWCINHHKLEWEISFKLKEGQAKKHQILLTSQNLAKFVAMNNS